MEKQQSDSIIFIENDFFSVGVNKIGGEICSFYSKKSSVEYIWSGDPEVWASTAPVLFPIIGVLKDGFFLYEGKKYYLPKHGFIRNSESLVLESKSVNEVHFSFESNEGTKEIYPFDFKFHIKFVLSENILEVQHFIENLSEERPLLFSLGGHPAFKCPFSSQHSYEDYFIDFEEQESVSRWSVLKDGTIGSVKLPFLEKDNRIDLTHELFQDDALIFKDLKSRKASLKNKLNSNEIEVSFNDFEYLGIWAKTNGDFVCIEPWLGISDSSDSENKLEEKEGVISLNPSSKFNASYSIKIKEGNS